VTSKAIVDIKRAIYEKNSNKKKRKNYAARRKPIHNFSTC